MSKRVSFLITASLGTLLLLPTNVWSPVNVTLQMESPATRAVWVYVFLVKGVPSYSLVAPSAVMVRGFGVTVKVPLR